MMRKTISAALACAVLGTLTAPALGATLVDIAVSAADATAGVGHSEPSIAVNPLNPNQIAVVAFSGNWGPAQSAPVWKSDDGGTTWRRVAQIGQPAAAVSGPNDQKVAFDRNGNLYVAELGIDSLGTIHDYVYRPGATPDAAMVAGVSYGNDQPLLEVDRWPASACVDVAYSPWLDTTAANYRSNVARSPDFGVTVTTVAAGDNSTFPNRTTRAAVAPDGKAYIVYKTREGGAAGNFENAHFHVKRSDDCGVTWNALGATGVSVTGVTAQQTYFTNTFGSGAMVARARSSDGWIATDPVTGDVYVAYVNKDVSGFGQVFLARSTMQGAAGSWTSQRVTDGTHNSAYPEIAVSHHGTVGVVYVDFDTAGPATQYRNHFARSIDHGMTWNDQILQSMDPTPFANASSGFIWGDYQGVASIGTSFAGVFSGASIGRPTPQLDPIFFKEVELATPIDFYVRDWTQSGVAFDTGVEPSTNPVFMTTSDVWNRRSNAPGALTPATPPDQENPDPAATNFAFTRVSRNTSGTAATVNAHFLFADYGLGGNFTPIAGMADASVPFGAGDTQVTSPSVAWTVPAVHSGHVCMAVEISTADDPIAPPDLSSTAPGPGDPLVLFDNNKAQRNMGIYPATGESAQSYYAVIHNPDVVKQNFVVRFRTQYLVQASVIAPESPTLAMKLRPVKSGETLTLPAMQPGENRWLELTLAAPPKTGQVADVLVEQIARGRAVNGFVLGARGAGKGEVDKEVARVFDSLKRRMIALRVDPKMLTVGGDPFGIRSGPGTTTASRDAWAHRLDAVLTAYAKAKGDPADALQMVRWQRALDPKSAQKAAAVIRRYPRLRSTRERDALYAAFVRSAAPSISVTGDPAALERAHRAYLLQLAARKR